MGKNKCLAHKLTSGAEAHTNFMGLRGAEAPLFHGAARICGDLRSL
jgi:hypothetical protein